MRLVAPLNRSCHRHQQARPTHEGSVLTIDKEAVMTNDFSMGYGMGFGWLWMIVILVLVGLAIAALVKYLRK